MSFLTNYKRVQGLGTAHEGVHHWWQQRVSSVALLILAIPFFVVFIPVLGAGHEALVTTYQGVCNAIVAILFIAAVFWHLKLGMQVVIEDYVHGPGLRTVLLLVNTLLNWAFGAAGIFAVAKIAFGA